MQAVLADQANSIDKTKKIPVLVVEDMDFANALVEAQIEPVGHLVECVFATTRSAAETALSQRNDFHIVFLDFHLGKETSEGLGLIVNSTQKNVHGIFATSANDDIRKSQMKLEKAGQCEKGEVGFIIVDLVKKIHVI